MKKDFIALKDLSSDEIRALVHITERLKSNKAGSPNLLTGKTIGMLFQKPSNRTRVSFDVCIHQLGGNALYLGPNEIRLGVRESTADVSKTLSRYLNAIVARVNSHDDLLELARHATIPVINGLSDLYHPCQGLTDLFSIHERFQTFEGITVAYVGDGNNVCHSLMIGCAKAGMNIHIATPDGYAPNAKVVELAEKFARDSKAKILLTRNPVEAVTGARVVYADVWVSMGDEAERDARMAAFEGFQINPELVKHAAKDYIFMHCLPAHRGEEVSAKIIDGKHSIVFDQAENRLHSQKAIITYLFERRREHR